MSKTAMKRANVRFNYEDYLVLPEDKRYEILDGDLQVVPAPNTLHQRISINLEFALLQHVKGRNLGEVLHAPYDVILSEENVLQPDILFVQSERKTIIGKMNLKGSPDLVIEILSQSTQEKDLKAKRKIYASFGVQEYWIVDPDAQIIEVLVLSERGYISAGTYGKADQLSSPLLPNLKLLLSEVFVE